jgi:hypothetical protein
MVPPGGMVFCPKNGISIISEKLSKLVPKLASKLAARSYRDHFEKLPIKIRQLVSLCHQ